MMFALAFQPALARLSRVLIVLVLSYVMVVEGFAAQWAMPTAMVDGIQALCLTDATAADADQRPVKHNPPHQSHAPCCLIFGTGDLPRLAVIVSAFRFTTRPASKPSAEFRNRDDLHVVNTPSLPRAPPLIG